MPLWNGRFRTRLDPVALGFSSSLAVDQRLYREDIAGSVAHVAMLATCRIISRKESLRIQKALKQILREIESGKFLLKSAPSRNGRFVAEDVHMAIEQRLIKKIGSVGGKLHTGRSRNDQIALDERLYLRTCIGGLDALLGKFQIECLKKAEAHQSVIMPGYTHLQRAQPVLFAHHLLAHVSMLQRDRERFEDCLRRVNRSPLGAGALAGTSFRIDRRRTASALGFEGIIENSIDAVSDRDVQIEFLSACAITMMHLSRFAEELVLWSSHEWNFIEIGDAYTTGSSIMPQKKNPDMAELVRGKTGRVYGDLLALLTVMKGLPLAYNRDLQEDKEPVFDAADTLRCCLEICAKMIRSIRVNRKRFESEPQADLLLATELADYLVRKGMPFRSAHAVVARVVTECISNHLSLRELSPRSYQRHSKLFGKDLWRVISLEASIANKKSEGSTSHVEVRKALKKWKAFLR